MITRAPTPLVGPARWPPLAGVLHDHDESAVVVPGPHDQIAGATGVGVLDRVGGGLVDGERDVLPHLGRRAVPVEPPAQRVAHAPQLLRLGGDPHLEHVSPPALPLGHESRVNAGAAYAG
jgi:hypothetical protein